MKRNFKILVIAALLITAPFVMMAQAPPHPNGGANPGSGNTKVGDQPTAPIGNGTFILVTLALAYAGRKYYGLRTAEEA
jgi:hypothetical protein